jgi:hypothetical protein
MAEYITAFELSEYLSQHSDKEGIYFKYDGEKYFAYEGPFLDLEGNIYFEIEPKPSVLKIRP